MNLNLIRLAESVGAVSYSPAPMRAVRGLSFTYEQLEQFAQALAPTRAPGAAAPAPRVPAAEGLESHELDIETRFDSHADTWPGSIATVLLELREHAAHVRDLTASSSETRYTPELIAASLEAAATHFEHFLSENEFPKGPLRGFVIEHADGGRWRTLDSMGMPDWTDNKELALCLPMREHADSFANEDPEDVRIKPVGWTDEAREAACFRWLRPRLMSADFDFENTGKSVLIFEIPRMAISADLDKTIGDALHLPPPQRAETENAIAP